ncbi:cell surface glycoprotein 1-like [Micropterus salmoides]|uniref:cell surface glycoprotein 1-like n=1 Tax=Micropterus salmoides TaxID=27706 RepID=UPI0018EB236F|nr:cell surface glycoprotein 1-like [Micropterus salmoides]
MSQSSPDQDSANGRRQKLSQTRIQQMKKGSSGPPHRSSALNQGNPDKRRLRRGETVEVSSPSASLEAGPRLRERPLGRCHTLDSGEQTPEQPEQPEQPEPTQTPQTTPTPGVGAQPDTDDTHSADDSNCSGGGEASPPSPYNVPPTHTSTNDRESRDPTEPSETSRQSPCPLNGELESSGDRTHTDKEALQSEGEDGDSSPTCPADLHPTIQADGGDQRDATQTPETSRITEAATEMEAL